MNLQRVMTQWLSVFQRKTPITQNRGAWAEHQAENHLKHHGLSIERRNYTVKGGEIDLIARDSAALVFVEVRYRHSDAYGSAEESITPKKQAKVRLAAKHYLQKYRLCEQQPCRFDIVALSSDNRINWIKDAF